ncbi:hypothetical protein ABB02_00166 [Clostridiaceae bacterium JG1575]|nr:hypothetical protein ABB02_00166 [Clostridiaceae bacterium JG1575]
MMQRTPQLLTLRYLWVGATALAVILSPKGHRLMGLMAFLWLLILSQYRLFMAPGLLAQRLLFFKACSSSWFVEALGRSISLERTHDDGWGAVF